MASPVRNVITSASTSYHELNQWLVDVENLDFKKRVLNGELQNLCVEDRKFILAYAARIGILHKAAVSKDPDSIDFISALFDAGMERDSLNPEGYTILALDKVSVERHQALFNLGVPFKHPTYTRLGFILNKFNGLFVNRENNPWEKLVAEALKETTFEELAKLKRDTTNKYLFEYLHTNFEESKPFLTKFLEWQKESPKECAKILSKFIKSNFPSRLYAQHGAHLFAKLIQGKWITAEVIELLYLEPKNLSSIIDHPQIFAFVDLSEFSEKFRKLNEQFNNPRLTFWCLALINAKSLCEAWVVLREYSHISQVGKNIPLFKDLCLSKVAELEVEENKTIWSSGETYVSDSTIIDLIEFGFDPNKLDKDHRNIMFFSRVRPLKMSVERRKELTESQMKAYQSINIQHKDLFQKNALEHVVWGYKKSPPSNFYEIRELIAQGLRLDVHFPYVDVCTKLFPNDPEKMTVLVIFHLIQTNDIYKVILNDGDYNDVAVLARQSTLLSPLCRRVSFDASAQNDYQTPEHMVYGLPQDSELAKHSKTVALFCAGLRGIGDLKTRMLLFSRLSFSQDEVIILFRYLTDHPNLFDILLQFSETELLEIIASLLNRMEQSHSKSNWDDLYQKVRQYDLHATLAKDEPRSKSRFVYLENGKNPYSLLKKFNHLKFVSSLANEFRSTFPTPGSVVVFRIAPIGQTSLQHPVIAFPTTDATTVSIFKQDFASFQNSQIKCLHDAGLMISQGYTPQLIKADKRYENHWKNYKIFGELFKIEDQRNDTKTRNNIPPNDFLRPVYLEMNADGLSHPEHMHSGLKLHWWCGKKLFLNTLESLGRTLVICLLNVIEYKKKSHEGLDFKNDDDCKAFIEILNKYLNVLLISYLKKPYQIPCKLGLSLARQILRCTDDVEYNKTDALKGVEGWIEFKHCMRLILMQAIAINTPLSNELHHKYYSDGMPGNA